MDIVDCDERVRIQRDAEGIDIFVQLRNAGRANDSAGDEQPAATKRHRQLHQCQTGRGGQRGMPDSALARRKKSIVPHASRWPNRYAGCALP